MTGMEIFTVSVGTALFLTIGILGWVLTRH